MSVFAASGWLTSYL